MIPLEKKKKEFESFITSSKFGKSTYLILTRFEFNFRYVIRTMELYHTVLSKLDNGDFKTNADEIQLRRTKQFIILDILSKLMASSESLFILLYALKGKYSELPKIVTWYPTSQIDGLAMKIKNHNLPLEKILGFPNLKNLNLDEKERKLFHKRYSKTFESVYKFLGELVDFYTKYKILYGKSKHGFSFFPDMQIDFKNNELASDVRCILAFDRKKEESVPPETYKSKFKAESLEWFNTVSILKISPKLLDNSKLMMKNMEILVRSIINNHLLFAENCGADFIPSIKIDQGKQIEYPYFFGGKLEKKEEQSIFEICERLVKNMHIIKRNAEFKFSYDTNKIPSIKDIDFIINIWSDHMKSD